MPEKLKRIFEKEYGKKKGDRIFYSYENKHGLLTPHHKVHHKMHEFHHEHLPQVMKDGSIKIAHHIKDKHRHLIGY